ncbi:hypothetical protein [Lignipirellula cremea]|uniref:Uncharacterized protein n=1 Tax=Lignipirellula cremea TaxID=2528010 RepID=A0A518DY67_9BACT|nr:hypothetical protein [Lignipirellula cremea]QDU96735.1 hypothetical protein Pla8534_45560 [Lignipirellula cremea]
MAIERWAASELEEIAKEWMEQRRMFSAFEVSLEAQQRGVRERHRNLKGLVHQAIALVGSTRGYTRTLMEVGAPVQAWVYHHVQDNPYTYRPLNRQGEGRAAPVSAAPVYGGVRNPAPLTSNGAAPASVNDGACGADAQGRLCIPAALLQRLDVEAGEQAIVTSDPENSEIRITRPTLFDNTDDAGYEVEEDGAIRISVAALEAAGLGGLQCYRVSGDSDCITVRTF